MSRTDIDPATLAKALRGMAGDGSIEWVMQPIQASVLLDVADALDENVKLRELLRDTLMHPQEYCDKYGIAYCDNAAAWLAMDDDMNRRMAELGIEVDE